MSSSCRLPALPSASSAGDCPPSPPPTSARSTSKYIAQAVILGDRQNYTGALIAPDFEEVATWAAANGLTDAAPEALAVSGEVEKLINGEVRRLLDDFAVFERPRRTSLLPRVLTEEAGELTPTLKTKLRVVQENWPDQIAHLFEDDGTPA